MHVCVDKNWRDGRFSSRTAKDTSRSYCMLFDEEKDVLLSGNTNGEVRSLSSSHRRSCVIG
jgi:hypothetical protein